MSLPQTPFIAFIEDDADDRYFLERAFEKCQPDMVIELFPGGKVFFEYLHTENPLPALVVTDISMPVVNGFDVIRRLKATADTLAIPVFVLSTSVNPADRSQAMQLGAQGYFVKPYTEKGYVEIVSSIVDLFSDLHVPGKQVHRSTLAEGS